MNRRLRTSSPTPTLRWGGVAVFAAALLGAAPVHAAEAPASSHHRDAAARDATASALVDLFAAAMGSDLARSEGFRRHIERVVDQAHADDDSAHDEPAELPVAMRFDYVRDTDDPLAGL